MARAAAPAPRPARRAPRRPLRSAALHTAWPLATLGALSLLAGNPLSEAAKSQQIPALKAVGVKVQD